MVTSKRKAHAMVSVLLLTACCLSGFSAAEELRVVADICPGLHGSFPLHLTNVSGTLYFSADDGTHGRELWKSDGTEAGTVMVKDIKPDPGVGSDPAQLTNVNGTLFFVIDDGTHGQELWKSDGTEAGTLMVKDINPGSDSSGPEHLTNVNGTLFFSADNGGHGIELWKSNGTEEGTVMVKDIRPAGLFPLPWESAPMKLTNVDGTLFFTASGYPHGRELWKSDGTEPGTVIVKDIKPGTDVGSDPNWLTNVEGTLFFTAADDEHGIALWKSDGTGAGTVMVKDVYAERLTDVDGTLFFANGRLWKSDGTESGTVMVKEDIQSAPSLPMELTNVNGTLFFSAFCRFDRYYLWWDRELWKSHGTEEGTVMVRDIFPGEDPDLYEPEHVIYLTNINGMLFFQANDGTHGSELWRSDGTEAGTVMVEDINPGYDDSYPKCLTDVNGVLFFSACDGYAAGPGVHGQELWCYSQWSQAAYVDADATGANNGSSWADAYNYLQDALAAASPGDHIWVAQGTYRPDLGAGIPRGSRTASFELINGVVIKGAYAGYGEPYPDARDIELYETILSGDLNGDDGPGFANNAENSYHVVTSIGVDPNTVLDGLTITGGNADGPDHLDGRGGAMLCDGGGSPTIVNCRFVRNSAAGVGGAIYTDWHSHSDPTFTGCMFAENLSEGAGGAMFNHSGCNPTLINCVFKGNVAIGNGGGMLNYLDNNPTVTNCTLTGNTAQRGGGMYNHENATLINSIFWGNSDSDGHDESSQVYDFGGATTISCSCIQGWMGSMGGAGNIGEDPLFVDADGADDVFGTEDDDLRLWAGSPCIDAGDNTAVPPGVVVDLDGNDRFFDNLAAVDTGTGIPPIVDMGAYECSLSLSLSLVAHWKLDETSGTIAYDSSGNGHHGTLYGDPNREPAGGRIGGALGFDGVDDCVDCGTFNPSEGTGQLSVTVWARWNGTNGQGQGLVAKRDKWHDNDMMWQLMASVSGSLRFYGAGSYPVSGFPILPVGEWSHVAAAFDGTTCAMYVDGVRIGSRPLSLGSDTDAAIVIGCLESSGLNSFNGALDDVRIYNYALNRGDIRRLLCPKPPRGDINGDCRVDFLDFAALVSEWLDCGMLIPELCGE